jgi:integrase
VSKKISAFGKEACIVVEQHEDKIQYATVHDLRRSFGRRLSRIVRPAQLQVMMRHRSLETTMKYYVGDDAEHTASELWQAFAEASRGGAFGGAYQIKPHVADTEDAGYAA